jgi:Holliday junction DNA helicase RuvA
MIGSLRGKLIEKRPNQLLVDVNGVGYQVQIPLSTFASLGALHAETNLLIHTHVREDQITLYGFVTAREKQCFELLISASGVGPSLALKILSGMSIEELVPAIRKSDLAQLVKIPGVGRKTAERIVVELRDKLAGIVGEEGSANTSSSASETESQVKSVLVNLGYDPRNVQVALESFRTKEPSDFDELLNSALRQLGGRAMQKKARARSSGQG